MKPSIVLAIVAVSIAALTGCSGDDGEISVQSATAPLTAEGNDKLFTIKIVQAREGGYSLDGLVVKATPDGKDPITLTCTTNDANGNKALDKDDTLDCAEGTANQFDSSVAGQDIDVELHAQVDGSDTKVGTATWTAPK